MLFSTENLLESINFIPPSPISLTNTTGNFWVNYTWSNGYGNITDSYNISHNGTWTNGTTDTFKNSTVGENNWSNISVYAYNNSGSGSLNLTTISMNTQLITTPVVTTTTIPTSGGGGGGGSSTGGNTIDTTDTTYNPNIKSYTTRISLNGQDVIIPLSNSDITNVKALNIYFIQPIYGDYTISVIDYDGAIGTIVKANQVQGGVGCTTQYFSVNTSSEIGVKNDSSMDYQSNSSIEAYVLSNSTWIKIPIFKVSSNIYRIPFTGFGNVYAISKCGSIIPSSNTIITSIMKPTNYTIPIAIVGLSILLILLRRRSKKRNVEYVHRKLRNS